jgi:SRSO17 transposase
VWSIEEPACPKAGPPSVAVARQDCGTRGQGTRGQVAVRLHGSRAEASCPLNWRLYLPTAWIGNPHRATHVTRPLGTPDRRKPAWALELIDQVRSWAVSPRPLVADAFYGHKIGVRPSLRQRPGASVVEVEPRTRV